MTYKLYKTNTIVSEPNAAVLDGGGGTLISFIFDPANTDYQSFKAQINAGEAQIEDADGVKLTAKKAKAFIATLP